MQSDVIAALLGAIIGAASGWLFNELTTRQRERRSEQKLIVTVRTLLSLEIDQNIKHLRDYWEDANNLANPSASARSNELQLARRVTRIPVPIWNREAWASQLPHVTTALQDDEIRAVHNIYGHLDQVAANGTMLTQLAEQEAWHSGPPGTVQPTGGGPFDWNARSLVEKMRGHYNEVLVLGNPLKPRSHR